MFRRPPVKTIFEELSEDELLEREPSSNGWAPEEAEAEAAEAAAHSNGQRADALEPVRAHADRLRRHRQRDVAHRYSPASTSNGARPEPSSLLRPDDIYSGNGLRSRTGSLLWSLKSEQARREASVDARLRELAQLGLRRSALVAAVSAKGGAGKTMLALALASTISRTLRWPTLVVDTDLTGGTAGLHTRSPANHHFTLLDVLEALEAGRIVGPADLTPYLAPLSDGASLLRAPSDPRALERIDQPGIERLIEALRRFYPIVILDNGPGVGVRDRVHDWMICAATDLVMVAFPKRVDALQVGEAIEYLSAELKTPITFVLNQVPLRPDQPTKRVMAVPLGPERTAARIEVPYDDRLRRQLDQSRFELEQLARRTRIAFKELAASLAGAWV